MLSKGEAKLEGRVGVRIDMLTERVDTLAATVATTASAMAKKDGEIASLRRELQARDEALQALAAELRAAPRQDATAAPVDANEFRSLRNAVAALMKDRAESGHGADVQRLSETLRALGERVDALGVPSAPPPLDPELVGRLQGLESALGALRAEAARAPEPDRPSEELRGMLVTLRSQVEALAGLTSSVTSEQLESRLADTDEGLARLEQRIDTLASGVESATASLSEKERELTTLHRELTDSSTRVEAIVDDIREALSAFPELGAASVDELATKLDSLAGDASTLAERLERVESASRETALAGARLADDLAHRLDAVEGRVAAVAAEVARARTLWPVALRSLEARLDDVASHGLRRETGEARPELDGEPDAPDQDLLAGLRDSLQAMETVAAEMARASDALTDPADEGAATAELEEQPEKRPEERPEPAVRPPDSPVVAAAGATVVPLRTADP